MSRTQLHKLKSYKTHDEFMLENFRKHPEEIEIYLKVALEEYEADGNVEAFLLALRTVAETKGGISTLAQKSKLNRQNLYRTLSAKGNPRFSTVEEILKALGFGLSVHAIA
jgi:probable addiction module antidote protein